MTAFRFDFPRILVDHRLDGFSLVPPSKRNRVFVVRRDDTIVGVFTDLENAQIAAGEQAHIEEILLNEVYA